MTTRRNHLVALALGMALVSAPFAVSQALAEEEGSTASQAASPGYPTSVESMIERRRDTMERRRDDYWDLVTGRRWRQPPWILAQRDWMERQNDVMDEMFRRRRDAAEQWGDSWGRWAHPWSQWRQDLTDARRDAYELDRLHRDEFFDRRFYGPPGRTYPPYFW